jgi:hypothetical protein
MIMVGFTSQGAQQLAMRSSQYGTSATKDMKMITKARHVPKPPDMDSLNAICFPFPLLDTLCYS